MWIFPFYLSAPASEVSTSASNSLCRELERSATWKGKSRRQAFWLRACETEPSLQLLFGRTRRPSTHASSAIAFIASQPGIRANRFHTQAKERDRTTLATFGQRFTTPFASLNRITSSSRMLKDISALDSARSLRPYARWATKVKQESLARRKSARLISGSASLRWPSARAEDAESCGNHSGQVDSLSGAAANWQTPGTDSFRSRGGSRKNEPGLDRQARNWPTPDALTSSGGIRTRSPRELEAIRRGEQLGRHHRQKNLSDAAMLWASPNANDHKSGKVSDRVANKNSRPLREQVYSAPAQQISKSGPSSSSNTRNLNPLFVEHLMGLPLGWTDFAPLAMESYRLRLAMHSQRLRELLSTASVVQMAEAA